MNKTYLGCTNLSGNSYFYSTNVRSVAGCFNGRSSATRLNIYVPANSNTLNTCLTNNTNSLLGTGITWVNDYTTNGVYYNATRNIYIYPVANVYNVYNDNNVNVTSLLQDFTYESNSNGTYTLTGWKGTLNGVTSTQCVIPNSNLIIVNPSI
jgi:hypothetical protein